MQREPIYTAIVNQLTALTLPPYNLVKLVSQGFVTWDDAPQQPAIYVVPVTETAQYRMGLPTKWMIHAEIWIYVYSTTASLGVQVLASILDAIDLIFSPVAANGQPTEVNTLGGLVSYCAIQGETNISGGFINQTQAVARLPLEVLVA
jgi:hypothetical protein